MLVAPKGLTQPAAPSSYYISRTLTLPITYSTLPVSHVLPVTLRNRPACLVVT